MEPVRLEIFLDDKTLAGIGSVTNNAKAVELVYKQLTERLQTELANVRNEMEKLNAQGIDTTESQKRVTQLENALEDLEKQMKATQAAGATPVVDTDVAARQEKSLGKLKLSFAQIARELPALAMGPQMFFLAISNNIPMVQDALHDARKENEALAASGKKGIPIWKQVAQSIVSWQTALAVAVTLLVVYGKEIVEFTKGLFGANEALVDSVRATEEYQAAVSEASGKVVSQLMTMSQEWANLGDNIAAQEQYILDNRDRFDELGLSIRDVSEAERAFVTDTEKVIQAMIARSEAATMTKSIEEEMAEAMELYKKWQNAEEESTVWVPGNGPSIMGGGMTAVTRRPKDEARKEYDDKIREIKELFAFRDEQNKIYADILKQLGIAAADEVPEGTVAYFDKLIEQQRKLLKESKSREEYQNIEKEIEQLEAAKERITGKKQQETGKERQQREKDLSETMLRLQRENQQAEIDLMAEGAAKKREQLKLDYLKQLDEIKAQEKAVSEATKGQMSDEQLEGFRRAYGLADETYVQGLKDIDKQEQEDNRKKLEGLLEQYRDYEQQRIALTKETNDAIAQLNTLRTDENSEEIDRAIAEAQRKMREGIQAINDEEAAASAKDSPFLKRLYGDFSDMAFGDLQRLLEQARKLQDYLSGTASREEIDFISPETLRQIEQSPEALDRLRKALHDFFREAESGDRWTQLFQNIGKALKGLKDSGSFRETAYYMGQIADYAAEASSWLSDIFSGFGQLDLGRDLESVSTGLQSVANIGKGFAQGGIVGGVMSIIGEAASLTTKGLEEQRKHEEALERVLEQRIAQQREYNLLLMEQNAEYEKSQTIFGTDAYGKATNAVSNYFEALKNLRKELRGDGTYEGKMPPELLEFLRKDKNLYASSGLERLDQYAGLADVQIKTGSYTTGAWFWKKQHDEYDSILNVYPELIDEQGNFNKELAQSILNTRDMTDESKQALQYFIDLAEAGEEALETMNSYLTSLFGEVGSQLSDALTNAFINGQSAAEDLGNVLDQVVQNFITQMAYSSILQPILEEAQKKVKEIWTNSDLNEAQRMEQITDVLADMLSGVQEAEPMWKDFLDKMMKISEDYGFDIFQPSGSTQTPDRGAFTALTQEQGTKLEGLFTSVQDHVIGIHQLVKQLEADRDADNKTLARIEENTAYCRYLETIDERLDRMERNGIKVN